MNGSSSFLSLVKAALPALLAAGAAWIGVQVALSTLELRMANVESIVAKQSQIDDSVGETLQLINDRLLRLEVTEQARQATKVDPVTSTPR